MSQYFILKNPLKSSQKVFSRNSIRGYRCPSFFPLLRRTDYESQFHGHGRPSRDLDFYQQHATDHHRANVRHLFKNK